MSERLIHRILVALDASLHSRAALREAAHLAVRHRAHLAGVFVEDRNLLNLAELPFALELVGERLSRPLNGAAMERRLRNQAEQIREMLGQAAARLGLRWSFTVERGEVDERLLTLSEGADLVVLGRSGHFPGSRGRLGATARCLASGCRRPVMITDRASLDQRLVLCLYPGGETGHHALELACDLAEHDGHGILALIPADGETPFPALEREARERLSEHSVKLTCIPLEGVDAASLEEAMSGNRGSILVLAEIPGLLDGERLNAVIDRLEYPVVVVR